MRLEISLARRGAWVLGCLGALSLVPSFSSASAEQARSGVYCRHDRSGTKVLAVRVLPDGNLAFGISIWSSAGNNIGAFGLAPRRSDHWEYEKNTGPAGNGDRCKIEIFLYNSHRAYVSSDPMAACRGLGGYNTKIGNVTFSHSTYEGAVTHELDDPDTFFGKAGRCWRQ